MKHKANIPPALGTTGSSSLVKDQETRRRDLDFPLQLLQDNATTVKEAFDTKARLLSLSKTEEYKTDFV